MTKSISQFAVAVLVAALTLVIATPQAATAKDTYESVSKDMFGALDNFADVLATVKDEASAKAAIPKLDGLKPKFKALGKRIKAVGKPSPEQEKILQEKFKKEQEALQTKMMGAMAGFMANPQLLEIIKPKMDEIGKIIASADSAGEEKKPTPAPAPAPSGE